MLGSILDQHNKFSLTGNTLTLASIVLRKVFTLCVYENISQTSADYSSRKIIINFAYSMCRTAAYHTGEPTKTSDEHSLPFLTCFSSG